MLEHGGAPDEGLAADVAEVGRGLALVPPHVDLEVGHLLFDFVQISAK